MLIVNRKSHQWLEAIPDHIVRVPDDVHIPRESPSPLEMIEIDMKIEMNFIFLRRLEMIGHRPWLSLKS